MDFVLLYLLSTIWLIIQSFFEIYRHSGPTGADIENMVPHPKSSIRRRSHILYGLIAAVLLLAGCSRDITVVRAQLAPPPPRQTVDNSRDGDLRDGLILFRQGKIDEARATFEQAILADSTNWQAYYFLGLIADRQDNADLALALMHRSLHFAPTDSRSRAQVYLAIASIHEHRGEFGQAELNYRMALNLYPESNEAQEALDRLAQRAAASNR